MRKENEKEIRENGKTFALTLALMNVLILLVVGGAVWLAQLILSQDHQLNEMIRRFTMG